MRFLLVAVGTAAVLWLAATAIGVSPAVLARSSIVFGFAGVICAGCVEAILKWRKSPSTASAEPASPAGSTSVSQSSRGKQ